MSFLSDKATASGAPPVPTWQAPLLTIPRALREAASPSCLRTERSALLSSFVRPVRPQGARDQANEWGPRDRAAVQLRITRLQTPR